MPVALPPPTPPAEVPVHAIPAKLETLSTRASGMTVHLVGFERSPNRALLKSLRRALTAQEVAATVTGWLYRNGEITAKVLYATRRGEVFVTYKTLPVMRVGGDPGYAPYFAGLAGEKAFDESRFERARILASAQSDRAGVSVEPYFVEQADGALGLAFRQTRLQGGSSSASVAVNNHGSRYAGQNGLDFAWRVSSAQGGEFRSSGRLAPEEANRADNGGGLYDGTLGYSQVSRYGVIGLSARWAAFTAPVDGSDTPLEGQIRESHLEWSDVLSASLTSRTLIKLQANYVDQEHRFADVPVFAERYWSAEAAPSHATALSLGRATLRLEGSAAAIYGSRMGEELGSLAEDAFTVGRPLLRAVIGGSGTTSGGVTLAGQWTQQTLPQQQQWTLGGAQVLPAYLPGAALGDVGAYARLYLAGGAAASSGWRLGWELFAEYGQAAAAQAADDAAPLRLSDAGLSLQLAYRNTAWIAATWAQPLQDTPQLAAQRAQAYVSIGFSF